MSKGLEALESLRKRVSTNNYGFGFADYDPQAGAECDTIEKELKDYEWLKSIIPVDAMFMWILSAEDKTRLLEIMGIKYE